MAAMMTAAFARSLQMPERAAEGFYFTFIRVALALKRLQRLEHFFHVFEALTQGIDDVVYLLDRALNARFGGRLEIPWWWLRRMISGSGLRFRDFSRRFVPGRFIWLLQLANGLE
jgi:hypothetical protein